LRVEPHGHALRAGDFEGLVDLHVVEPLEVGFVEQIFEPRVHRLVAVGRAEVTLVFLRQGFAVGVKWGVGVRHFTGKGSSLLLDDGPQRRREGPQVAPRQPAIRRVFEKHGEQIGGPHGDEAIVDLVGFDSCSGVGGDGAGAARH
jgi:hypothetical protein